MPELPEVETIRAGLLPFMDGQSITNITINRYDLRFRVPDDARQITQGQRVEAIDRHGKYLLVRLGNDQTIVWHMGMSGSVRIYNDEPYEEQKHDHIVLETSSQAIIAFNDPRRFGMFYIVPTDEVADTTPFSSMGTDALSITAQDLYNGLQSKKSPIKTALLDQRVIAGLGNIYVCEALYRTGVDPRRPACDVPKDTVDVLYAHIADILGDAIEKGGSSLKDHRMTDGSMGYFQNFFGVYGKKGLPCPDCTCNPDHTGGIAQIKQAGRSTFYCPQRQV
jgi:formamidopyrimidine-DNA glycosylase